MASKKRQTAKKEVEDLIEREVYYVRKPHVICILTVKKGDVKVDCVGVATYNPNDEQLVKELRKRRDKMLNNGKAEELQEEYDKICETIERLRWDETFGYKVAYGRALVDGAKRTNTYRRG